MFFCRQPPTPYDLHFRLFGIPTRIHPGFWLFGAVVCFDLTRLGVDFWIVGILCVSLNLFVHELGHALAFKVFRAFPEIDLQLMSGMATPDVRIGERWKRVLCIAAGPGLGLLFAAAIYGSAEIHPWPLSSFMAAITYMYLFWGSLILNLFNLLPIFPLDGGQLMLEGLSHRNPRTGLQQALQVSVVLAVLYCGYCILGEIAPQTPPIDLYFFDLPRSLYIGFIFGLIAWQDRQMLERIRPY